MKKIKISAVALIVITGLLGGILPVMAAESSDAAAAGNAGGASFIASRWTSQKSAAKASYTPLIVKVGDPLAFALSAADPDNNQLVYSASNLPPGATFDPLTATFSWTPAYGQAGVYPGVHFEVSDGELTDSEDITITVNPGADATAKSLTAVFRISNLNINPSSVNPGKKVNIRATVTNEGTADGDYDVTLKINGTIATVSSLTVPAGSSVTVTFTSTQVVPGVYNVDVNGLTGSFEVSSPKGSGGPGVSGGSGGSRGRKA
jgi:hypothetical protein